MLNVRNNMINNFVVDQSFEHLGCVIEMRKWMILLNLTAVIKFLDRSYLVKFPFKR